MEEERKILNYCAHCGEPIYMGSSKYEGDEYVDTLDGLIHYWECWSDYGYKKIKVVNEWDYEDDYW